MHLPWPGSPWPVQPCRGHLWKKGKQLAWTDSPGPVLSWGRQPWKRWMGSLAIEDRVQLPWFYRSFRMPVVEGGVCEPSGPIQSYGRRRSNCPIMNPQELSGPGEAYRGKGVYLT